MKVLGVVVVMLVACKSRDNAAPSPGSAATAPTPVADAAPVESAPTAPTFSQSISSTGIGPINATTDVANVARLFPGLEAKTEHTEASGRSLDTTSLSWPNGVTILQVVVDNVQNEVRVDALASSFATQSGIRVGSTVGDLLRAHVDAECRRETTPGTTTQVLLCATPSLPNLSFHLDPAALTGSDGKVAAARVAAFKIVRISWKQTRAPTAGATTGKPFCLTPGTDLVVDRLVATNDSATFCAPGTGTLSCATISFATGDVSPVTGAPPAKPVAEEPKRASPDGKVQLARSGNTWSLVDAKSKKPVKLAAGDKEHACPGDAQFIGPSIYVSANACDKPHAVGYLFNTSGKLLGQKLDAVNLHEAKPFHLDGNRWLFHSADSEEILFVDAVKGGQAVTPTLSAPQGVRLRASIAPFARMPNGKVVTVGAAVAIIDPATGSAEKNWLLPVCGK